MPKPWKPLSEYSIGHQNKLKRKLFNFSSSDEECLEQDHVRRRIDDLSDSERPGPIDSDDSHEIGNLDDFENFNNDDDTDDPRNSDGSQAAIASPFSPLCQSSIHSPSSSISDFPRIDIREHCATDGETDEELSISDSVSVNEFRSGSEEEDDESEYDEHDEEINEDELLYEGAPITVAESMIAILNVSVRHNITGVLLSDILRLIALHCPPENKCKKTVYTFEKYFSKAKTPLIRHFYCSRCFRPAEQENSVCHSCVEGTKNDYFIEIPIIAQLEALFERPGFHEMLNHRYTRQRDRVENYEDIFDGEVYKDLSQAGGFLHNPSSISFTWYADGISIFKSSKFSIWVVFLIVNELPYAERIRKENIIIAALWFGDQKPQPNLFLEPLLESIEQLREEGIGLLIPNNPYTVNVKGIVICGSCDLPAKALFQNMKQYNGEWGCQKCKQKGDYLRDKRVRVYPYEEFELRTDEETFEHAQQASNTGVAVCGVKGPTILSSIVYQNMRATAVDAMHCVFEGVVKSLLKFWFTPKFSTHPSSLIQHVDLIDHTLSTLTPPSSVQRLPRSIKKHLAYWKAHEFKAWLFWYSIVCLNGVMDETYFKHYRLLILGISILCQSSISPDSLGIASRALNEFVSMFQHLYGLRNMSNNLHQLLHLTENVRQFGPLWTTSCFPFEDLNGKLKNLVHGSNSAQLQIHSAASMFLHLTTLKTASLHPGSSVHTFCENLEYKRGRIKRHHVSESVYIVGTFKELLHLPRKTEETLNRSGIHGTKYFSYQRLLRKKVLYCSTDYRRGRRTNSTFAIYTHQDSKHIGRIRCFIRVADCLCPTFCNCMARNFALLQPCVLENRFSTCIDDIVLTMIHNMLGFESDERAVDIHNLQSLCFYSSRQDTSETYVIEPVNMVESE